MTPRFAHGGIGDLLQKIESAIVEKEILLFSHYTKAPDLFAPFNVSIIRFEHYKTLEELGGFYIPGLPLENKRYANFKIPDAPFQKTAKKVIGIHIEGSALSNNYWAARGQPGKNMTKGFLVRLLLALNGKFIHNKVCFYVFCSPERKEQIQDLISSLKVVKDFKVICFDNIWESLSCVTHCDVVVGMDSCIKSFSAMLRIPTITLVGNYKDIYRDQTFLTPYVEDGVMKVVSFTDIDRIDPFKQIVSLINL